MPASPALLLSMLQTAASSSASPRFSYVCLLYQHLCLLGSCNDVSIQELSDVIRDNITIFFQSKVPRIQ